MKAIRVYENGDPDVLKLEEVQIDKPGPHQALVRNTHAGLNFVDTYIRRGIYPCPLPYTPGWEGAGVVEEVGSSVRNVKPGDHVAYAHQPGSYAEKILTNAEGLIVLPDGISSEEAAAFPLQGMTAHYLLHEFRTPKAGETILIHAAAGGMGLLLVQWARHLGFKVIGTVSTEEKAKAARSAGAHDVILYTKSDFVAEAKRLTDGRGVDFIIDGVGKTTFAGNLEAAALRGHIVIFGASSGPADPIVPNALMGKSLSVSGGSLMNYILTPEEMLYRAKAVLKGMQEGWLKITIDKILPLAQAADAHRALEDRKTIGKVLLAC